MATNTKTKQRQYDRERESKRGQYWAFFIYPDSAPANFRDILNALHIKWILSPLHENDIDEATGQPKKPHYHVILIFSGKKSYDEILQLTQQLNQPIPQKINSLEGAIRYLVHIDNPDKAQYSVNDIEVYGNIDLKKYFELSASQKFALIDEMIDFIAEFHVVEYMDLRMYARMERPDWNDVLHTNSYEIIEIIKSQRHGGRRPINPVTGEMYFDPDTYKNQEEPSIKTDKNQQDC